MGKLKNIFSWSFSAGEDFDQCRRRHYWKKYGSWGGWDASASPEIKKAYLLKNMNNCILTNAENIIHVNDWLVRNQDKASQIANAGRNFVLNNHTLESRSADLLKFLKKILANTYKGAYWKNGKLIFI